MIKYIVGKYKSYILQKKVTNIIKRLEIIREGLEEDIKNDPNPNAAKEAEEELGRIHKNTFRVGDVVQTNGKWYVFLGPTKGEKYWGDWKVNGEIVRVLYGSFEHTTGIRGTLE